MSQNVTSSLMFPLPNRLPGFIYSSRNFLITAGLPQSGKLPVLNLLTGQKSAFSPRTRCTDSLQSWRGRRDW